MSEALETTKRLSMIVPLSPGQSKTFDEEEEHEYLEELMEIVS